MKGNVMNKAFRRLLRISKNKDMSAGLAAMHRCKPTALTNVLGVQSLKKSNLHAYPEQKGSHTQIIQWPRIKEKTVFCVKSCKSRKLQWAPSLLVAR